MDNCKTCRHYDARSGGTPDGLCRAYAPAVFYDGSTKNALTFWPRVKPNDWCGTPYVTNGGAGFRKIDVDAIMNIATTAKEIGEGIGNKGLGFRSIEALTSDVRIFSRRHGSKSARFDGYCFRFAAQNEIEALLRKEGIDEVSARNVARIVPRYLVPLHVAFQPDDVLSFARRGYASTIVVPLHSAEAVALAKRQVQALVDLKGPPLLFLDRIAEFRINVETPDSPAYRRTQA